MNGDGTKEVRIDQGSGYSEELPSLSGFADPVGGTLEDAGWGKDRSWYKAEVIEGYQTRNGKVFETGDEAAKMGDSRNLRLCLRITNSRGEATNLNTTFNYRVTDFSFDRLEQVKEARKQFAGVRGRWEGNTDVQRTSLAIAGLGQMEKGFGFRLKRDVDTGRLNPRAFVGKVVDVRLRPNDNGFSEVVTFAEAGSRTR